MGAGDGRIVAFDLDSVLAPLTRLLDCLVHPRAGGEAVMAARQRSVLAVALACASLAALGVPGHVFLAGFSWTGLLLLLGCLALSLAGALWQMRTGALDGPAAILAGVIAALVAAGAVASGGLASPLAPALVAAPLEAAVSGRRKAVLAGLGAAAAGLVVLAFVGRPAVAAPGFGTLVAVGLLAHAGSVVLRLRAQMRALAEKHAREAERHALVNAHAGEMAVLHAGDGAVTYVSPASYHLFGLAPVTLARDGLFRIIHPADRPAYLRALAEAINGAGEAEAEMRLRHSEAQEDWEGQWAHALVRKVRGGDGTAGVLALIRPDDGRHALVRALAEAEAQIEAAGRDGHRLVASLAHEIRTPLNAIIGFADLLGSAEAQRFDAAKRHEYAALIRTSGTHLLELIDNVLDAGSLAAGRAGAETAPVDVSHIVEECRRMMATIAESRGVAILTEVADELPPVIADARLLRQILINLLSNAVKFSRPGGRVVISLEKREGALDLCVRDSGIGIAADVLPRLGQPFVQAQESEASDGVGLGLSLVKALVARMHGTFSMTSALGRGTSVSVTLPLAVAPGTSGRAAGGARG